MPSRSASAPSEPRAGQEDDAGVLAGPQQRLDQRLRRRRCRSRARRARRRARTAGSRLRRTRDRRSSRPSTPFAAPGLVAAPRARGSSRRRRRRRSSLPQRTCGTSCAAQNSYSSRRPSTHSARLQRAGRIVDAGVDDAAVVRARVEARPRMPFEHARRAAARGDGRADASPVTPAPMTATSIRSTSMMLPRRHRTSW